MAYKFAKLCTDIIVVAAVVTSASSGAYKGRQMDQRDEKFHQIRIVLEHICHVSRLIK